MLSDFADADVDVDQKDASAHAFNIFHTQLPGNLFPGSRVTAPPANRISPTNSHPPPASYLAKSQQHKQIPNEKIQEQQQQCVEFLASD
ncbi:hypothetical protein ACLKA7_008041 [Drosophila subpalustris]